MSHNPLSSAIWHNLCAHVRFVQARCPSMLVKQWGPVLLVDSGLSGDTFNKLMVSPPWGGGALEKTWSLVSAGGESTALESWTGTTVFSEPEAQLVKAALTAGLEHFSVQDREVSLWTWDDAPASSPQGGSAAFSQRGAVRTRGNTVRALAEELGLMAGEVETAMSARLADLPPPEWAGLALPGGGNPTSASWGAWTGDQRQGLIYGDFRIEQVATPGALQAFAAVLAANWSPPDAAVSAFYEQGAPLLLREDSPMRLFVAWAGDEPVACSEVFLGGGPQVAGLHMLCTRQTFRHLGLGAAMTWAALDQARRLGAATAVLVASTQGKPLYARMGFATHGTLSEYVVM